MKTTLFRGLLGIASSAATVLSLAAPSWAARLTWEITFFDELGSLAGQGVFQTDTRSQTVSVFDAGNFTTQTVTNLLQPNFRANVQGVVWNRSTDPFGVQNPNVPVIVAPVARWLDGDWNLQGRVQNPGVWREPGLVEDSWYFPLRDNTGLGGLPLERSPLVRTLSLYGGMLGDATTNTWEQWLRLSPVTEGYVPPPEQTKTERGTWTATLRRSTPEPSALGAGVVLLGYGVWRRSRL